MAEKGAELVVRWLADTTGLEHGAAKAEAATEKTSSKFSKLGLAAKAGAVGGVLLLAEGLNKSVEAAEKDQVATTRLENAFKAAHVALAPYKDRLEAAEHAGAKLGFTGEQVKDSIGSLVVATHDGKTAIGDLAAAEDIARFKHIDLAAATKMLVMAQTGSQRATKQLGLEVQATTVHQDRAKFAYKAADDAIKAQFKSMGTLTQAQQDQEDALRNNLKLKYDADKVDAKIQDHQVTGAQVTEMVTQKLHGQADAYASTAAGARERLGAAFDELEVKVGQKLLPILTKLTIWLADNLPRAMERLSQFWKAHGDQIIAIANKVEAVLVPTFRMIADAIRLVADLLQGHWAKAWVDMKRLVVDEIDAVKARIMLQVDLIKAIFGGLAEKVLHVTEDIGMYFARLPAKALSWGENLGSSFKSGLIAGFHGLAGLLAKFVEAPINAIIAAWNAIEIPSFHVHIPVPLGPDIDFGTPAIGLPDIPYLAQGGFVEQTGIAVVHRGEEFLGVGAGRRGGVHAHFYGPVFGDKKKVAREIVDEIHDALIAKQRGGSLGFA
jgi:hypothetical protein